MVSAAPSSAVPPPPSVAPRFLLPTTPESESALLPGALIMPQGASALLSPAPPFPPTLETLALASGGSADEEGFGGEPLVLPTCPRLPPSPSRGVFRDDIGISAMLPISPSSNDDVCLDKVAATAAEASASSAQTEQIAPPRPALST